MSCSQNKNKMKILTLLHFRVCCLLVNLVICLAMMVTVPLCLVGWCWSVGWGVSLVNIASEYLSSVSASEHLNELNPRYQTNSFNTRQD